jgi:hypothetical protein
MIRFQNVGIRYGMGPEILRDVSFEIPTEVVSIPERTLGRWKDDAAAPAVSVAEADAGPDKLFSASDRSRISNGGPAAIAATNRRGVPGFPSARPYDDL